MASPDEETRMKRFMTSDGMTVIDLPSTTGNALKRLRDQLHAKTITQSDTLAQLDAIMQLHQQESRKKPRVESSSSSDSSDSSDDELLVQPSKKPAAADPPAAASASASAVASGVDSYLATLAARTAREEERKAGFAADAPVREEAVKLARSRLSLPLGQQFKVGDRVAVTENRRIVPGVVTSTARKRVHYVTIARHRKGPDTLRRMTIYPNFLRMATPFELRVNKDWDSIVAVQAANAAADRSFTDYFAAQANAQ